MKALLDGIENSDAGLQDAIAFIITDSGKDGQLTDFKKAAAYIVPYNPVAKKCFAGMKGKAKVANTSANRNHNGICLLDATIFCVQS